MFIPRTASETSARVFHDDEQHGDGTEALDIQPPVLLDHRPRVPYLGCWARLIVQIRAHGFPK